MRKSSLVTPAVLLAMQRAAAIDCRFLGTLVMSDVPPQGQEAWARQQLPADAAPRGISPEGLPTAWRDALAWCGAPLARGGELRWGRDLAEGEVVAPEVRAGVLLLPPADELTERSGPELKPLRRFLAERLGVRLQAAAGVRFWLWRGGGLVLSFHEVPVGVFVYGDAPGHRAHCLLQPGAHEVLAW
jgi:hypothetical protein